MRVFVTAADEAALRVEINDQLVARWQESLAVFTAEHAAEVARLREDRAAELARVVDPSAPFVAHLTAEVAFWRDQFQHERQRAEQAIDQCRGHHQALGPVSLPLRAERDAPVDPAAVFQTPELLMMGLSDGVE